MASILACYSHALWICKLLFDWKSTKPSVWSKIGVIWDGKHTLKVLPCWRLVTTKYWLIRDFQIDTIYHVAQGALNLREPSKSEKCQLLFKSMLAQAWPASNSNFLGLWWHTDFKSLEVEECIVPLWKTLIDHCLVATGQVPGSFLKVCFGVFNHL